MWGGSLTRYRPPPLPPQEGRGLAKEVLLTVGGPVLSTFAKASARAMGKEIKRGVKRKGIPIATAVGKKAATSLANKAVKAVSKRGAKRIRDVLGV